jgi:hypothetical protein
VRSGLDPPCELLRRHFEAEDPRRVAGLAAPEGVFARPQARAGLRELERAYHAAAVVRMDNSGRLGIALSE